MVFYRFLSNLVYVIEILIFVRIIFSFLRIDPYNQIGKIIYDLTEPILAPARELIYRLGINTGMFDFSPIVAILILRTILFLVRGIIF
ncbi:YggT family protein [Tepidimicrobium xylanilyticum]|uniref:YggT family protein n=1 Tax=Tepidimicrobium xylanilyticum TaxID=1123352 RepID=A0A1H2YUH3_9FIRM|nr:YggT family protein [Tepidimicrobium xylanilyticum]GMG97210.1 YggT family protein [Tepidimicrobium xylanilyticum]SDX08314.1 YggT family protein [Tepidimicrobium xylanilyticum]